MALDKLSKHLLVPKHEIVPEEKVGEVLKEYGLNPERFPRILRDDPTVTEIGAKKGDLIKITRDSITAGRSIYFRMVK
ncbi:MAG: DNA-directed RNA polymerase subunit H [Candidatus Diapherotrites archaeon]|uniref:DNA-directed RNA polymerase subunit Rpo5 n=1 Tax=Candidatus Iainarchaeum sp. TaxID=3101447 RepID=A0A7J4IS23_9ARCH|nr:MAG: DNA-directed RNA polymerase subunit H [archaeon GW2011_AR10]MBS3059560.1 DNA-directed RNA polymerase subunit H [Candidatus Diapherotrites archaeon]HIH08308.1 DNA-directed RNA polymerase subunit H [Candidatus Diapherotrites archaeon]